MNADRSVCDCNVLISAAIVPAGKPRKCLDHILDRGKLVLSAELFNELSSRLSRPKFSRYLDDRQKADFLRLIVGIAEFVVIGTPPRIARDPDDDKVIETAIIGRAPFLLTGDKDLLALRAAGDAIEAKTLAEAQFKGVSILRPSEYLALVEGDPSG